MNNNNNKFDVKIKPAVPHHSSDRTHIGEHNETHGYTGGKPPKPKHGGRVTPVHGGMVRHMADGSYRAFGGHDASYLDSLSGATVPGDVKSAPGWGNATVRTGNPMAIAPAGKRLRPVPVHPNMSKGPQHDQAMRDLGEAVLRQAFSTADAQTQRAHGRRKDGSK